MPILHLHLPCILPRPTIVNHVLPPPASTCCPSSSVFLEPSLWSVGGFIGVHLNGVLVPRQNQGIWAIPIPQGLTRLQRRCFEAPGLVHQAIVKPLNHR